MKNMKKILAAVMVIGMGRMLVLYTTNPPTNVKPKDLWQEGVDLLYPSMGGMKDYKKARELFERVAAQQDDLVSAADAKKDLAEIYEEGLGVEKDTERARNYFNQAFSTYEQLAGNAEKDPKAAAFANLELGYIYEEGDGEYALWVKPDEERSRNYFEQARTLFEQVVDQYDPESVAEANIALGDLYEFGYLGDPDYHKAQLYYERVAHNQQIPFNLSIEACFALAQMYEHGQGDGYETEQVFKQDIAKAINYYNRVIALASQARKAKDAYRARMAIADIYAYGEGKVAPDFVKARAEYQKIGELVDAQLAIAFLYRNGQGDTFPRDIKRAEKYYKSAIANHNASEEQKKLAWQELAIMFSVLAMEYYSGSEKIKIDYALARQYLNKVLAIEDARPWNKEMAHYTLGQMSYEGQGDAKNYVEARDHFDQVIAADTAEWLKASAELYIGKMYYYGQEGILEQNYNEALSYFTRVIAEEGARGGEKASAELYIGKMYYYGQEGIFERNYNEAFSYFTRVIAEETASDEDKAAAKAYLGRMYYRGQGVAQNYTQAGIFSHNALNINLALQEQAIANYTLGLMHYWGHGVPVDVVIALQHLILVANNIYADPVERLSAQEMIGLIENPPNLNKHGFFVTP